MSTYSVSSYIPSHNFILQSSNQSLGHTKHLRDFQREASGNGTGGSQGGVTLSNEASRHQELKSPEMGQLMAREAQVSSGNPKFGQPRTRKPSRSAPNATTDDLRSIYGGMSGGMMIGAKAKPQTHQQLQAHFKNQHGAALAKLSPEQQTQFLGLAQKTQSEGQPSSSLSALLDSGKLLATDKSKSTVLDHLNRLSNQPLQKGVDRKQVLGDLTNALANPRTFDQNFQSSCTVTAIGREHARTMPADFARINTDLLSAKAETKGQNGEVIKSGSGDLGKSDASGRNQLVRVVKTDESYVYIDNPQGAFEYGSTKFSGGPNRELVEQGGLVRMKKDEFFNSLKSYETLQ